LEHRITGKHIHALVVEDDELQRDIMVSLLQSLGISPVLGVPNGRQAMETLRRMAGMQQAVDVVFCDLNMPEMDGLEFLRRLGQEGHEVAVVIVSALGNRLYASVNSMAGGLGIRVLDIIEKPVTSVRLKKCLSRYGRPEQTLPRPPAGPSFVPEDIVAGVRAGQFEPWFQPKVDLVTGRLVGAEALARWMHPSLGVVGPEAFIPQLEQSGNIDELTFEMIARSAAACRGFRERRDMTVSVNLSLVSLNDSGLADRIIRTVRGAGLEPRHMILEISETAAMSDVVSASENLARLCMHGFALSIDDYGTGYANMQQLMRIAFSELKIDRSFFGAFADHPSSRIVVESSVEMARRLNLKSVAEGVETQDDWDALREAGCDIAQGYFIAKPMDLARFGAYLGALRW